MIQKKINSQKLERLEATSYWKAAIANAERFEEKEKEFFLGKIKDHFCSGHRKAARYYSELVGTISKFYNPSLEAQRTRLLIVLENEKTILPKKKR